MGLGINCRKRENGLDIISHAGVETVYCCTVKLGLLSVSVWHSAVKLGLLSMSVWHSVVKLGLLSLSVWHCVVMLDAGAGLRVHKHQHGMWLAVEGLCARTCIQFPQRGRAFWSKNSDKF